MIPESVLLDKIIPTLEKSNNCIDIGLDYYEESTGEGRLNIYAKDDDKWLGYEEFNIKKYRDNIEGIYGAIRYFNRRILCSYTSDEVA